MPKNFPRAARGVREALQKCLNSLCRRKPTSYREPTLVSAARVSPLKEKMEAAKAYVQKLRAIGEQLQKAPDKQISLTDPDSRSMATSGRGTGIVGYNVQTVVETKHHLIVAHEVTNVGHDRSPLHKMATQAREALGTQALTALADRGYFTGEEILACEEGGSLP